jgi:peptide/nickel transport system substrate-binding protein
MSQLVDELATSIPSSSATPDALDPGSAFFTFDGPVMANVFQELVTYDGNDTTTLVPVLASNWTISANSQTYTFEMRPNVWFSNMDPINAYTAWFSFVRTIYENAPSGVAGSNYNELTENLAANNPDAEVPVGTCSAIASLGGNFASANASDTAGANLCVSVLNNMLSNFNPSNSTQDQIMSYAGQSYQVINSSTFVVHLMSPYAFFGYDVAAMWGAIVDPTYVDAHGGVQNNTVNSYFDANGGPGSGPYEIASVGAGYIPIVLKANPNYWAANVSGLAPVLQPAHINTIIIQYGASQLDQINTFGTNEAQISWVAPPYIQQMYNAYNYKSQYPINDILLNSGYAASFFYVASNTQVFPTNITDFRLAVAHAVNMSEEIQDTYTNPINGQPLAENYMGPMLPQNGQYYDPGNIPPYQVNISLAIQEIAAAGQQGNFYVTLPNATTVGCTLGTSGCKALPAIELAYLTPLSPLIQSQLQIIQANLQQIGLAVAPYGETPAVFSANEGTAATSPVMTFLGWYPDWPDPVFQLMLPAATSTSFLPGWLNNATINNILATLPFDTNQTSYIQGIAQVYQMMYQLAPYDWFPNPAVYFFVQPYLHGFTWNGYVGYYYNMMYYS